MANRPQLTERNSVHSTFIFWYTKPWNLLAIFQTLAYSHSFIFFPLLNVATLVLVCKYGSFARKAFLSDGSGCGYSCDRSTRDRSRRRAIETWQEIYFFGNGREKLFFRKFDNRSSRHSSSYMGLDFHQAKDVWYLNGYGGIQFCWILGWLCTIRRKLAVIRTMDEWGLVYGIGRRRYLGWMEFLCANQFCTCDRITQANPWFQLTLGQTAATTALEAHYNTITADNITSIASYGFNHVRIPISFWAFINLTSDEPYVGGIQLAHLDRIAAACYNSGIYILLDL